MRLATFNILHGRSVIDDLVDVDRLAAAIASLDADVLALQEVDRNQPRSHLADLTAVAAAAMGAVSHRFVAALSGTPGATWMAATEDDVPGSASYGVALLSRYPVRTWQSLRLPRIGFRFPMYLPGPRKVIMVDEEPRAAVIAHLDTPSGPMIVTNTHLSFVPGWGRLQLRRIRRDLATLPDPAIVMGDLNMDAPRPAAITGFRSLADHPTFPLEEPSQQLDHILARGEVGTVVGSRATRLPLSDHLALVVDLADPRSAPSTWDSAESLPTPPAGG
ncbi:MAG TPA: endonuclease/exonuclease/phosphatase family protein [Microlunatus sp.]